MTTVAAPLDALAREAPGAPALTVGGTTLARRDLAATLKRLEGAVAARTAPGETVALVLPNGFALALLFLACARTGRVAAVLDREWTRRERDGVLAALAPRLVVAEEGNADILMPAGAGPEAVAAALASDREGAPCPPRPQDAFYIGFTSGTTGLPKGYRRSHASWVASFEAGAREFAIGPHDHVLAPGAFTHSLFLYALVDGLQRGAHVTALERFRPRAVVERLAAGDVSVLYGVPTQLRLVLEAARGRRFPSVRLILSSGAKWPTDLGAEVARIFPGARHAEFYGASELSFVALAHSGEPVPEGSVGRPFPEVAVTIRGPDGARLPPGRVGRIHVESPFLFDGYAVGGGKGALHRLGKSLSVGDHGWLDEAGWLFLAGREGRMLVTSGVNVYAEEVERVLESHPDVAAAVALGEPDRLRGTRLVAIVRPGDEAYPPAVSALRAHCRDRLAEAKRPRRFLMARRWPMTRSGKTDAATLADMLARSDPALEPLP